jgi:hypothetical protein
MEVAQSTTALSTDPEDAAPKPLRGWALVLGYVGALLAPGVGVMIGVLALRRRQTRHGAVLLLISAAMIAISIAVGVGGRQSAGGAESASPGQVDLSSPEWREFNACAARQGYEVKQVIARCHVPGR